MTSERNSARGTKVGFPLYVATQAALAVFARHFGHVLRVREMTPDERQQYTEEWAVALRAAPVSLIEESAVEWIAQRDEIPRAKAFADFVRARALVHAQPPELSTRAPTRQEALVPGKAELARVAFQRLGRWELVARMFDDIMTKAGDDAQRRSAVRDGVVALPEFEEALRRFQPPTGAEEGATC